MGFLIYLAIIGIQFTNTLATGSIPLRCLLKSHSFLDILDKKSDLTSPSVRFNTLKVKNITLDKDDWIFDTFNLEYQGLDDAVLDDFGFNLNTNVAQVTFHTDLVARHLYKTSGTLFSEPIEGEGTCVISLSNVQYSFTIPFEIIEENGKNFVELKEYQYSYDVRGNAKFTLKNLYNGNKELSDSMLSRMNQNWRYLTVNFGRVFMDAVADRVYTTFRNYMLATPLKDFNTC